MLCHGVVCAWAGKAFPAAGHQPHIGRAWEALHAEAREAPYAVQRKAAACTEASRLSADKQPK